MAPRSAEPLWLSKPGAMCAKEGRGRGLVRCVSRVRVVKQETPAVLSLYG